MEVMMRGEIKREIEREIELAKLMVKDLKKLWSSYATKAFLAKQERESRQAKKGFLEYETVEELIDAWGGAYIDEDTYYRGIEYFENLNKPPQQSVIEQHRTNIKEILNRYEGTLLELNDELNPPTKVKEENAFERRERELRDERCKNITLNELLK